MSWQVWVTALALVLLLEGFLPFVAPTKWKAWFGQVVHLSEGQIRFLGAMSLGAGLLLIYLLPDLFPS